MAIPPVYACVAQAVENNGKILVDPAQINGESQAERID
jgi:hypothetical protein